MPDKLVTFNGPTHFLEVPGFFTIARGESHLLDDHMVEAIVRANPDLDLTVSDPPKSESKRQKSQPEAHQGEGQPESPIEQEE